MLRTAFRVASAPRQAIKSQKRFSGCGVKKNIHIEENAGLREITYWTWDFDMSSVTRIFFYMVLPAYFFISHVTADFVSNK